jgi:hypothetical protein
MWKHVYKLLASKEICPHIRITIQIIEKTKRNPNSNLKPYPILRKIKGVRSENKKT